MSRATHPPGVALSMHRLQQRTDPLLPGRGPFKGRTRSGRGRVSRSGFVGFQGGRCHGTPGRILGYEDRGRLAPGRSVPSCRAALERIYFASRYVHVTWAYAIEKRSNLSLSPSHPFSLSVSNPHEETVGACSRLWGYLLNQPIPPCLSF